MNRGASLSDHLLDEAADHFEVVVIGAGQAGLAIGHLLADDNRKLVILEAGDTVGTAWRNRWDSLVLFTPRRFDALPGMAFPGDPDGYPTRNEVIAYLERYAEAFELPIKFGRAVQSLTYRDGFFELQVEGRRMVADQVVVANGPFQVPFLPDVSGQLAPDVLQVHSADYRRPADVPAGRVLVVGGGNTGFQIAKELSSTHEVDLAVGSRQTPLPQRVLGRDLFWWLTKLGLLKKTVDSRIGQRAKGRDTLIGSTPRELKSRYGVGLKQRVVGANGRSLSFADGSEQAVDAVIWATGYLPDHSWIDAAVFDDDGQLRHRRGVTDVPGLYFLGLSWQHTRGSALLGWVKDDARFIAEQIAATARTRRPVTFSGAQRDGQTVTPVAADEGGLTMNEQNERHNEHHHHEHQAAGDEHFSTAVAGLPEAVGTEVVDLDDGDRIALRIAPVAKRLGDTELRMLAYNGSIPGTTIRVCEGSTVEVEVFNEADLEATVHWHGLRLDNRYDGTHETQAPIPVGGSFTYHLEFPDPGVYWYHPHIREDYGQELGLYGNIVVVPRDADYWPPAHRELALTLDDLLVEDGKVAPFSRSETNYAAMGRFGNVMLVSGEPRLALGARTGEVVRLYLTNTANTRVFKVALPGAQLKLVGGDSGRYEYEQFVEAVVLAPSERAVIDALFASAGELTLEHQTPGKTYPLATIHVGSEQAKPILADRFAKLRQNPEWAVERVRLAPYVDAAPDKTLALVAEMDMGSPEGPVVYTCPMHPDVVSNEPDRCPKCGMKLLATAAPTSFVCPMHPDVVSDTAEHCPKCGMKLLPASVVAHTAAHDQHDDAEHDHAHQHGTADGIEWEDDMVDVNRITTPANTRWNLIDRDTGAVNHAIDWQFRVGDLVKVRLVNEMDSDHPMHHPFHIHGAGRFVVLARNGVAEENLVWKDTVLVRTAETVDILLEVTHAGIWMAHCHIAEHHESGMMFSFKVAPAAEH